MSIFELEKDQIVQLPKTSFIAEGVKERKDLQKILRSRIDILDLDLLVIAEEYGNWEESRRRIDRVLPAAVRGRWGSKLRASSGGQFGRPPANGRSAERISADAAVDRPALLLRLWWRGGRRGMAIKGGPPHINNGF